MKLWTWKYKNESDPKIPSRYIKWEFKLPYVLKLKGKLLWKGHSFSISIPLISVYYMTGTPCGKFWSIHKEAIYFNPIWYGAKGVLSIALGIPKSKLMDWKIARMMKKMKPEERNEIINQLKDILSD